MARDMARNKTATSVDFTPKCNISTGGGGGGNIIILAIVVIVALIGLAVTITSALVAIVVVPILNIALRMLGLPSSRLKRLYTATFQAVAGNLLALGALASRSEENTSELQSLMSISSAVFCL